MKRLISFLTAFVLVLSMVPAGSVAVLATEETFDTENFKGLVLTTSVTGISVKLYKGYADDAPLMTPVYTEGTTYYYEVEAGGKYYYTARPSSGYSRYHIRENIYVTAEEANTKMVMDVTPAKRSTAGWDTYEPVKQFSAETLAAAFPSSPELWPEYAHLFTTPVFTIERNPHRQTTQTEMMNYINGLNGTDDDMYVYILGKSGGSKSSEYFDIPVVFFTGTDLSGAATWEEAAALLRANGKLTVFYQAQIHGKETGGGEAALAMLREFDGDYGAGLLDNMNICVVPRLNTWGAYKSDRSVYANGAEIDANRDFLKLESNEIQLRTKLYQAIEPEVCFDGHEYFVRPENETVTRKDMMLSTNYTPTATDAYREMALTLAYEAYGRAEENNIGYGWYDGDVNGYNGNIGSTNSSMRGSLMFLTETMGILGGNNLLERRMMGHISMVTGVLDYVNENTAAVQKVVDDERQNIVNRGKTYEDSDVVILDTGNTQHPELYIDGQNVTTGSGEITDTVYTARVYDVVRSSRTAPTAYVIPAGETWTDAVLEKLTIHGIAYTKLPAGAQIALQQYTGTTTAASLTQEQTVTFPKGAYVMTMAQEDAYILALLMEPDVEDVSADKGTFAQQGLIPSENGTFPIYRYIHDLNAAGFIDYTVSDTVAVNVTVYLDGTNGLDTNNGLSATAPVKTMEQAYTVMATALQGSAEGSRGTVVISGVYELGKATYHFPACTFPVTITGKTTDDGLSFTGGSGDAQIDRAIHLHGDTTFQYVKLHVNNGYSYNYIFANGHKLVMGANVNTTVKKTNYYFAISGGSVNYGDKVASVDVTIQSGKWKMIYLGGYYGDVTGAAKLNISNASVLYSIVSSYRGNVGSVEMNISNTAVSTYKTTDTTHGIFAGTYTANSNYNCGKILGDVTIRLGENVTAPAIYGTARSYGHVMGNTTFILDGADYSAAPIYARYSGLSSAYPTRYVEVKLARDVNTDLTVDPAITLDLAGYDITGDLTVNGSLTVYDSATDDYTVADSLCGEITGTVTGTLVAKEGYIAAANGFHRFGGQYISSVSLRPGNAGIYYTATFLCDEVLADALEMGVAVSLADMPGADFETDEDTRYTVGTTGVMIQNILTGDTEDADRAIMDIYAAAYVKLPDGTVVVSENTVAYSLYDVLCILKTQNPEAFNSFCETWNIASWF